MHAITGASVGAGGGGQVARELIDEIGDVLELGVLTLDRNRVITGWNRWLEIASGRRALSLIGRPLIEVFPDFSGSHGDAALARVFKGATVVMAHRFHECFLRFPSPPGETEFPCMQQSARLMPHIDQDGRIVGAVVIIDDVTERVARDRELRMALHVAESANKAKADFLASMSHELRTPLGAISGYADLLAEQIFGQVNEIQKQHLVRIKGVAAHLLGIVDEILTFSRIQAGREEAHMTRADAVVITGDAALMVEPQLRTKGVAFNIELPPEPILLMTDPARVRQILINLLGNAVKFVERGSVTLRVFEEAEGDAVAFEVADTGPGIADQNLQRVFEPFTQVDSSLTRRAMGTGLGLPLSRQLAQLLGGDITLISKVGVGSTFRLSLPRDRRPDDAQPAPSHDR